MFCFPMREGKIVTGFFLLPLSAALSKHTVPLLSQFDGLSLKTSRTFQRGLSLPTVLVERHSVDSPSCMGPPEALDCKR